MQSSRGWRAAIVVAALLILSAVAVRLITRPAPAPRELLRTDLDLREGVLFAKGEVEPFSGLLIERYPNRKPKIEIEIADGKAHGRSRGWYESGQLEVEEQFLHGTSHGPRTRWYENGQKRSEARIEHGQLSGAYVEWHENGQRAVEMSLAGGKPDGVAEAWHASGARKSQTHFRSGEMVKREFFDDAQLASGAEANR
jgi:antitoxin component YwqK of YwqJK toxin-antitoxin module